MDRWLVDLYWELRVRYRRLSEPRPFGHLTRGDINYFLRGFRPGHCRKLAGGQSPKTYYLEHWPLSK